MIHGQGVLSDRLGFVFKAKRIEDVQGACLDGAAVRQIFIGHIHDHGWPKPRPRLVVQPRDGLAVPIVVQLANGVRFHHICSVISLKPPCVVDLSIVKVPPTAKVIRRQSSPNDFQSVRSHDRSVQLVFRPLLQCDTGGEERGDADQADSENEDRHEQFDQ